MNLAQDISVIGAIAAFWLVAMIVPGLDFLLVTRLAMMKGRMAALRATLGIATGIAAWGLAGFFGIRTLFIASPWLYTLLKVGGGLYLFIQGARLFAGSWKKAPADDQPANPALATTRAFRMGLLTNLANPKAPIFVSSLFAAVLPQHASIGLGLACVGTMFLIAVAWFALVATVLSLRHVSRAFLRLRHWIDRASGLAFMALGIRFATEKTV
ncbi:threonine export protein RhtC [Gluconacetobacter liquefaciens]|uniref:Threonine/homoserine/homoserine lactone efflux protein n=2 Tax=Gluconacetobacter liquefaciens TaxID=89584 RepID=A0A370FZW2_GLULI|nr:LysE family transporter [Gluconacetobacter liquefaciens]RDI36296.1 threonine/homoserine/homoserine lactone efflux protein [Gluconacetobacter liquefaciens]GBR00431.1 putative threonine efflux protein [Gluconacetobacter liquefaciens NRIC 0522]GEB39553.1 threonine export protein RhtC [Gluconacetobacter liquefaciens]